MKARAEQAKHDLIQKAREVASKEIQRYQGIYNIMLNIFLLFFYKHRYSNQDISKNWLAWNKDRVYEWSVMSSGRLIFQ